MSHLGQRLSALIDGELADAERDRVLAHLARCDECRREATALRALKQRMHTLGEAMADAALTGRLMAVAGPDDPAPWAGRAWWRSAHSHLSGRYLAAGLLASAMVGLGATAFLVGGGEQVPGPRVTPAVGTFLVQHAMDTGELPAVSQASPSAAAVAGSQVRTPGSTAGLQVSSPAPTYSPVASPAIATPRPGQSMPVPSAAASSGP